ncbi:Fanconi anemia group C protein [Megalops cyprinoides]|uniref:Fanconi anemia group C protein n=1 Tax=Megalops cyprinoides TaxID=118141 RepID=UPI0018652F1C|nr:Fanconi anemia group C protein [Megalops cyprinoides]
MAQTCPFPEEVVDFWVSKAVAWGQATDLSTQVDVSLHLGKLRSFLQQLHQGLQLTNSTTEAMRSFPFVGQFLGRLCWNPCVSADEGSLDCLLQCLWRLHSAEPQNAVERRANQWIRSLLHHLSVEERDGTAQTVVKHLGCSPLDYRLTFLKNMVSSLVREVRESRCTGVHLPERCLCDNVRGASVACVPLVTCPEVAPLIGALLQCPAVCDRAALSEEFLEAVSAALLGKKLVLEEEEVMSLWYRSLPSLERAVLQLLEFALLNPAPSFTALEQRVADSLLPKAAALQCPVFLITTDIFRKLLLETRGSCALRALLQAFTRHFLLSLRPLDPQERLPLKAFFPRTPQSLLTLLLQNPTEVQMEAWPEHLLRICHSLQRVEEEEEDDAVRRRWALFEGWFLLVRCGDWVDVAAQLLVSAAPDASAPLLWLLTFYHQPMQLEQQRARTLTEAGEALDHLRALFLTRTPPPLPPEHLRALLDPTGPPCPPCPPVAPLVQHLLLSFAVFSHAPLSTVTEVVRKALGRVASCPEAVWFLAGVERRLNTLPDPRVHSRLRTIQEGLAAQDTT